MVVSLFFSSTSVSPAGVIVDCRSCVGAVTGADCSSASVVVLVGNRVDSGTKSLAAGVDPSTVVKAGGSTGVSTILSVSRWQEAMIIENAINAGMKIPKNGRLLSNGGREIIALDFYDFNSRRS